MISAARPAADVAEPDAGEPRRRALLLAASRFAVGIALEQPSRTIRAPGNPEFNGYKYD